MFKKAMISLLAVVGLTGGAMAAGGESHVEDFDFSFEGPFGRYDQAQLRRGWQVYSEVCAACHGLRQLAFRNLSDEGGPHLPTAEMEEIAAGYDFYDATLDEDRPGKPTDKFPAITDAGVPDLSLMAKARAGFHGPYGLGINQLRYGMGGPEYIASFLTGYTGEKKEEFGTFFYENTAFPGGWVSMSPPLEDGLVEFEDGHANDAHHLAEDVSAFLMWAADPKLNERKAHGFVWVIFLSLVAALLYFTNKKLWAPIKRKD